MDAIEEPRRGARIAIEAALAGLLVLWRCTTHLYQPLYLDIPLYLGLFWLFLLFRPAPKEREAAALGLMLVFLAVYLQSVMPNLLYISDLAPP